MLKSLGQNSTIQELPNKNIYPLNHTSNQLPNDETDSKSKMHMKKRKINNKR
jgi:hypothetical protein